jgi:hypothetical protein
MSQIKPSPITSDPGPEEVARRQAQELNKIPKTRATGVANYTTTPIILPEFPEKITLPGGATFDTRKALPIARAILLEGIRALKIIPGGATRTVYSLERACFHLQRVTVAPRGKRDG